MPASTAMHCGPQMSCKLNFKAFVMCSLHAAYTACSHTGRMVWLRATVLYQQGEHVIRAYMHTERHHGIGQRVDNAAPQQRCGAADAVAAAL